MKMDRDDSFDSLDSDEFLMHEDELRWKSLVFLPFHNTWQSIMLANAYFTYLATIYEFFFDQSVGDELFYNLPIDILYFMDLVLSIIHRNWDEVRDRRAHLERSLFCITFDAISVIPASFLYYILAHNFSIKMYHIFSFNRLFRIYRVFSFLNRRREQIYKHQFILVFIDFFILFTCLVHLLAAMWYCLGDINDDFTWKYHLQAKSIELHDESWYLMSLYFVIQFVMNTSVGDLIGDGNLPEIWLSLVCMFGGFILMACIFMGNTTSALVQYRKQFCIYFHRLRLIEAYMANLNIKSQLRQKIHQYYESLWDVKNGIQKVECMDILPLSMRMQVNLDIFWDAFRHSRVLRNLEQNALRALSLHMKSKLLMPGEEIFLKNKIKRRMVYIVTGIVQILTDEDDESPLVSLSGGTVLGESTLVISYTASHHVKCASRCEVFILEMQDFTRAMIPFPDQKEQIQKHVAKLFRKARGMKHLAIRYESRGGSIFSGELYKPVKWIKKSLKKYVSSGEQVPEIDTRKAPKLHYTSQNLDLYVISEELALTTDAICLTTSFPFILQPNSTLLSAWNICVTLSALIIALTYPYVISYTGYFFTSANVLFSVVDVLFYLDIIIQIFTAIRTKDELVTNVFKILEIKLGEIGFLVDIFSILPFDFLLYFLNVDSFAWYGISKCNRLFKLWKVSYIFGDIQKITMRNILLQTNIKYALYVAVSVYVLGCMLFKETCFHLLCTPDGWFATLSNLQLDIEVGKWYKKPFIMSVYFASELFTLCGIGDIQPTTETDVKCVIVIIIVGSALFAYCMADISSNQQLKGYQEYEFKQIGHVISDFMKVQHVPVYLRQRVFKYMATQWVYENANTILYNEKLLSDLSDHIKNNVLFQTTTNILRNLELFQNCDLEFLQKVAESATCFFLPPDEVIVYSGQVREEFVVVCEGYCVVTQESYKDQESKSKVCGANTCIGDLEALLSIPQVSSAFSLTHCKIMTINIHRIRHAITVFGGEGKEFIDVYKEAQSWQELENFREYRPSSLRKGDEPYHGKEDDMKRIVFTKKETEIKAIAASQSAYRELGVMIWLQYLLLPRTFHPNGFFIKIWEVFRVIFAFFTVMVHTDVYAFEVEYPNIHVITVLLDITAYIDIYVRLHVGYYTKQGILVSHPLRTAQYYLSHSFIVDLLGCYPLEYLGPENVTMNCADKTSSLLRLNRLLQIYRMVQGMEFFENGYTKHTNLINILKYSTYLIMLLNVLSNIIVVSTLTFCKVPPEDTSTCRHYDYAVKRVHYPTFIDLKLNATLYNGSYVGTTSCNWYSSSVYYGHFSPSEIHYLCFLWMSTIVLKQGISDPSPQTYNELVFFIILSILAFILLANALGLVAHRISISNLKLTLYQQKMKQLLDYMTNEDLDVEQQQILIDTHEHLWKNLRTFDYLKVLRHFHPALRTDILYALNGRFLAKMSVFANQDIALYEKISLILTHVSFIRESEIIKVNDVHAYMYIVKKGKVSVRDVEGNLLETLCRGDMFGNLGNADMIRSTVNVTIRGHASILKMKTVKLYKILEKYPVAAKNLEILAIDNIEYAHAAGEMPSYDTDSVADLASINTNFSRRGSVGSIRTQSRIFSFTSKSKLMRILYHKSKWYKSRVIVINVAGSFISTIIILYNWALDSSSPASLALCYSIDGLFYMKILLEFFTTFEGIEGQIVSNPKKTMLRYLKSTRGFFVDVLSTFPFEIFAPLLENSEFINYFYWLRLNRTLRVAVLSDYFRSITRMLHGRILFLKIMYSFIMVLLLFHFVTAFWVICACPRKSCISDNRSDFLFYSQTMFYGMCLFTKTGISDLAPKGIINIFYMACVEIISIAIQPVFIGEVSAIAKQTDFIKSHYHDKVNEIMTYCKKHELSESLQTEVWEYVCNLWYHRSGNQFPELFLEGPRFFMYEIKYCIYGGHLKENFIFSSVHEDCLRQIAAKFIVNNFYPGNYIAFDNDVPESIYFIHEGQVEVLVREGDLIETIKEILHRQGFFGLEQGIMKGKPLQYSYRARTACVILILQRKDWIYLLDLFPSAKVEINKCLQNYLTSMPLEFG